MMRVGRDLQLMEVSIAILPFGFDVHEEHDHTPERGEHGAAPQRPRIPRTFLPAPRERPALPQGVIDVRPRDDGELLPKKKVREKARRDPDLKREEPEREKQAD